MFQYQVVRVEFFFSCSVMQLCDALCLTDEWMAPEITEFSDLVKFTIRHALEKVKSMTDINYFLFEWINACSTNSPLVVMCHSVDTGEATE